MYEKQLISQGRLVLLHPEGLNTERTMNRVKAECPSVNEGAEQGSLAALPNVNSMNQGVQKICNNWIKMIC